MKSKEEIRAEIKRRKEKALICKAKKLYEVVEVVKQVEAVTALEWVLDDE